MSAMGLDIRDHETQPLTEPLVRHADVIFTMTRDPSRGDRGPMARRRRADALLVADESDVCDPIGGPLERYQHCAAQIRAELEIRLDEMEL